MQLWKVVGTFQATKLEDPQSYRTIESVEREGFSPIPKSLESEVAFLRLRLACADRRRDRPLERPNRHSSSDLKRYSTITEPLPLAHRDVDYGRLHKFKAAVTSESRISPQIQQGIEEDAERSAEHL